jgi:hypothetical protein
MFAVISRKSITVDEIVMIPSAYYHLAAGNFQLVNEHPPLAKIIAGVPALFVQPNEVKPEQIVGEPGSFREKWSYAERFWENNPDIFESLSFWPRVPAVILTVLLGFLIFKLARELFGPLPAVLAVALFTLEPTVLAHGRVVQTDIPATLGYLLLFFAMYRYAKNLSLKMPPGSERLRAWHCSQSSPCCWLARCCSCFLDGCFGAHRKKDQAAERSLSTWDFARSSRFWLSIPAIFFNIAQSQRRMSNGSRNHFLASAEP